MNIGQICSHEMVSVPTSATLGEVARLMHDRHVGSVVVTRTYTDAPAAVGIITDRDIVRTQLERKADLWCLSAEEVMTRDPLVLREDLSIGEGIERLRARGVRRAPVVSVHGMLVGVVSTDDLLAALARELGSVARLFEAQPKREPG
ncbi:MAG TPA: CBS domain-containing protein [Steroidobacteraceae bacterium]|nr:CBS domain-containing protein [Steroidobacteraceae bacterium]